MNVKVDTRDRAAGLTGRDRLPGRPGASGSTSPVRGAAPVRGAVPGRRLGPARSTARTRPAPRRAPRRRAALAAAAAGAPEATAAGLRTVSRTPFILLLVGLLGGGLICLLVINTTLAAASFRISDLQKGNVRLAQQAQNLQQQVSTARAPSAIEQRAYKLGMRPQSVLNFIDLRSGRRYTSAAPAGAVTAVPGYGP